MRLYYWVHVNSVIQKCGCDLWEPVHCNRQQSVTIALSNLCVLWVHHFQMAYKCTPYWVDSINFLGKMFYRVSSSSRDRQWKLHIGHSNSYMQNFHNLHGRKILFCYIIILCKHKQTNKPHLHNVHSVHATAKPI